MKKISIHCPIVITGPTTFDGTPPEAFVGKLDESGTLGNPVVTEVVPLEVFYEAEPEHKQFYLENPDSMYCQIVIRPKVAKVREMFSQKISSKSK